MKGSTEALVRRAQAILEELHAREVVAIWGVEGAPGVERATMEGVFAYHPELLVVQISIAPPSPVKPLPLLGRPSTKFTPSEIERGRLMIRRKRA